jgi:GNAT superfamily N-acetyltransferase
VEALSKALPVEWSHGNPIDILGDAKPERYAKVLEATAKDSNSDGLLVILAPQAVTDPTLTAEQLKPYAKLGKPILASWMGGAEVASGLDVLRSADIPSFSYPDTAVRMFLYMLSYHENLRSIYETPLLEAAEPVPPGGWKDACELLELYDFHLPEQSPLIMGCTVDDQLGPVLYVEGWHGRRVYGLPPLTTSLAGLVLDQVGLRDETYERLLVRLARLIGRWRMKNGEEVTIRPIRAEDEPLIARFHETLSERTVYFRYLSTLKLSTRIAHERLVRICYLDYARQMALVVERANAGTGDAEIVAVGRLVRDMQAFARGNREAEFALVVSDSLQGQGIGKELLRRLLDVAKREGVDEVFGEISSENMTMQKICRSMGFLIRRDYEDTTVTARYTIR